MSYCVGMENFIFKFAKLTVTLIMVGHMKVSNTNTQQSLKTIIIIIIIINSEIIILFSIGIDNDDNSICLLGFKKGHLGFTQVGELYENETDLEHRLPMNQWWLNLRQLTIIMAKHPSLHESKSILFRKSMKYFQDLEKIR